MGRQLGGNQKNFQSRRFCLSRCASLGFQPFRTQDMHWVVDVIDHNRTFEEDPFYSAKAGTQSSRGFSTLVCLIALVSPVGLKGNLSPVHKSVFLYQGDSSKWRFRFGKWPPRNTEPGKGAPRKVSSTNGCFLGSMVPWLSFF